MYLKANSKYVSTNFLNMALMNMYSMFILLEMKTLCKGKEGIEERREERRGKGMEGNRRERQYLPTYEYQKQDLA